MEILNFTPHAVNLITAEKTMTFEPKGLVRLKALTVSAGQLGEVPLTKTEFGEPEGLPEFKEGTYYIVSQLVKSALPNRPDLLVPAELVRDEQGAIVGCKSFGV